MENLSKLPVVEKLLEKCQPHIYRRVVKLFEKLKKWLGSRFSYKNGGGGGGAVYVRGICFLIFKVVNFS